MGESKMMIDPEKVTRKMIDFQKVALSSFSDAAALAQSQATTAVNMTLDQATWIPDQGREAILSWVDACQEGCRQFVVYAQDSFAGFEDCLGGVTQKPKTTKIAKKASPKSKNTPDTKS
jgi:hypothetical protein